MNEREAVERVKKYIDETRKMIGNDPEVLNMANGHKLLASDLLLLAGLASQAQQESQWISVEERLPDVKVGSFEFYLVTTINLKTKKQSVSEAAFLNEMELYNDDCDYELFSGWHSAKESKEYDGWYEPLGHKYCKVTHWMPLPLPPAPHERSE